MRVAQRNQVGRALRGHDPGDPGDTERVALRHAVAAQQRHDLGRDRAPGRLATASRAVTSLAETSTIRAAPDSSTWVSQLAVGRGRRRIRSSDRAPGRRRSLPASTDVVVSGTTIRRSTARGCRSGASRARRPGVTCAPRAVTSKCAAHELLRPARRGEARRCTLGPDERTAVRAACPSSGGSPGSTKTSNEMYDETGLPGKREDRGVVLTDRAEALRLAGLHRHLGELARCRAGRARP